MLPGETEDVLKEGAGKRNKVLLLTRGGTMQKKEKGRLVHGVFGGEVHLRKRGGEGQWQEGGKEKIRRGDGKSCEWGQ